MFTYSKNLAKWKKEGYPLWHLHKDKRVETMNKNVKKANKFHKPLKAMKPAVMDCWFIIYHNITLSPTN